MECHQELCSSLVFSCPLSGVLSLVTVQPTAATVAKQLLPKTLGPSNVNIAAHMQHVPHMVSDASHNHHAAYFYNVRFSCFLDHVFNGSLKPYTGARNAPLSKFCVIFRCICV